MSKQGEMSLRVCSGEVEQCCPPLSTAALTSDQAAGLTPMFKALADPVRLRLISLLASTTELCVCDLSSAFDLAGPTISHHLKVLREAGLIDSQRRGTWIYYRAKPAVLGQLSTLLDPTRTLAAL